MQDDEFVEEVAYQNCLQKKGIKPYIFDGFDCHIPAPYNTVTIHLDGQLHASLNWTAARELALKAVSHNLAIFWDIDLGLFDNLSLPLTNQTQFLSLGLSLEHFKNTLGKEFAEQSIGISIFRGYADFSLDFRWDEEQISNLCCWLQTTFNNIEEQKALFGENALSQIKPSDLYRNDYTKNLLALFCRDISVEYLVALSARLSDEIPCYIFLDASNLAHDPLKQAQLLNPDRFDHLELAIKGATLPFKSLGWHSHVTAEGFVGASIKEIPSFQHANIAICLPLMNYHFEKHWQGLDEVCHYLLAHCINFRLIPESQLITDWDGLDFLIYNPQGLSPLGKRKLQGFCAAGGEVVSVGELLDLPYEISWNEWKAQNS